MRDWTSITDYVLTNYPVVYARPFDLVTGRLGEPIRIADADPNTWGTPVAAIAPGVFVVAVGDTLTMSVHRIDVL